MGNRILIDTNVLLDYLLTREPFYEDAKEIVQACVKGQVKELLRLILFLICFLY